MLEELYLLYTPSTVQHCHDEGQITPENINKGQITHNQPYFMHLGKLTQSKICHLQPD